jgi:hypothetical protein
MDVLRAEGRGSAFAPRQPLSSEVVRNSRVVSRHRKQSLSSAFIGRPLLEQRPLRPPATTRMCWRRSGLRRRCPADRLGHPLAGDPGDPKPRRARRQAEPECRGGAAPGRRVADEVGPVAWGVPRPPCGYRAKKEVGKTPRRKPLPRATTRRCGPLRCGKCRRDSGSRRPPPPLVYEPDVEPVLARVVQILWEARAWNGHAG